MNQSISKSPNLFIISSLPTFIREITPLLSEIDLSYMVHLLFFHQHEWEKQRYSQDDVILFDTFSFPQLPIKQLRSIRVHSPSCKILAIGGKLCSSSIYQLIQLGINGYLSEDSIRTKIEEAIQTVKSGQLYLPANIGENDVLTPGTVHKLPQRELQVLTCMGQGMSSIEIAEELFLSVHTIQTYRKRLFKRFNVNRTPLLIKIATLGGYL